MPLEKSKPKIQIQDLLEATKPMEPFPFDKQTDMSVDSSSLSDLLGGLISRITSMFKRNQI